MIGFIYLCAVFILVTLFVLFFRDSGFDLCCVTDWFFAFIIIVIVIFFVFFMIAFNDGIKGVSVEFCDPCVCCAGSDPIE